MRDTLFVFIILFWLFLGILSNMFEVQLAKSSISDIPEQKYETQGIFDWLAKIPGISLIVPLMKIMAFQYTDQIPLALTLVLDALAVFSLYIIVTIIRGT